MAASRARRPSTLRWPISTAIDKKTAGPLEALYRRVFGPDAAEASRLRWEWQYRRNPNNPGGAPVIWIAREGPTLVGQYATMPVRLQVHGQGSSTRRGAWT